MTPEEQVKVAAVTGELVGHVKKLERPYAARKGETWREIVWDDPSGNYEAKGHTVDLVAHMTGIIIGIVYEGEQPVGLKMVDA